MKLIHENIQYIEFASSDLKHIQAFYEQCFGWKFESYDPEYLAFTGEHVDGGFFLGTPVKGSILVVVYSSELESTLAKVRHAGGVISKEIFSFPGGRRFQFIDTDGNELAVWSDT
ncbi:MAG: hypothetical protein RLZZ234_318 [Candidatus Parcubacteria bacterium]|jgi:predicted enzyme related to lactoylglutathione lyase